MENILELEKQYCAQNYKPLPVILTKGKGIYVWDLAGKKYLDFMSAYSALSFGHSHPVLVKALQQQAKRLALTSRAYYSDQLGPFAKRLCELTHQDKMLPMNSGAEAVETAIKAARKWGHSIKKIPENQAEIIVCQTNFHGRTLAIISMSTEPQYRAGFGPFIAGFKIIPYSDARALAAAITPNTAAFLVEPVQGEGGVIVPPRGYLKECAQICRQNKVLLIADEVQTGLGRTGKIVACEHEQVQPDGLILGKALGGGLLPVSAFLARQEVMDVFTPGDHGSTFGGNPLACAVGLASLNLLVEENLAARAAELGQYLLEQLQTIKNPIIKTVRGQGLMTGIEVIPEVSARDICIKLLEQGILSKDTHATVLRFMPPLIISKKEIDHAIKIIKKVFHAWK